MGKSTISTGPFSIAMLVYQRVTCLLIWVCLKMLCTPKPNGFADHYPVFKWLFHWEYTLFSDKPIFLAMFCRDLPYRPYIAEDISYTLAKEYFKYHIPEIPMCSIPLFQYFKSVNSTH